jgi:alpha-L-rhamnosidase
MWLMFNDESLLAEHYEAMESYMHSLEQYGLEGPKPTYGDWLSYEKTDPKYIGMAYYAHDAALMEKFSNVLSRYETKYVDRAAYYHLLRRKIVRHFRETYLDEKGELTQTSQTAYLLALAFDLVEEKAKPAIREHLRRKIVENGYRLSTGFVGTGVLNQTLGENGMNDLAYALLLQTEDPSWLYSVRQGATTIWERWNSYTVERGFGDVGMNSFNHYAYGAVAEWMFGYMAGIRPDPMRPGFEHFILAPKPDNRPVDEIPEGQTPIRRVKAHYTTPYGTIKSAWEYVDGLLHCSFTIPTDTTATVIFPAVTNAERICINDRLLDATTLGARVDAEGWHFELSAGHYDISESDV